ncbi:hypothetical protein Tco_1354310 [Tanacetum coccineum]
MSIPQDEDEHEFSAEEQPLPPVDSPTAESPRHVTESDPEEDPEEYEDDETEDGLVDYPIDGGDNGDDDDGDSSRDDANDEDEDDEDEDEEEEHIAPVNSTIVAPVDEPVFPPEGTEPVIPPPSTDITIGARVTVRPQTSISLPPEEEVERLLTMITPSPSPPLSLSPPSAGERFARIAFTQALINAVIAALPSPPLPLSLYIPPPVDRRDDIPESEQPPSHLARGGVCLLLASRYEIGVEFTARLPVLEDIWVESTEAVPDLYALLKDAQDRDMDGGGGGLCFTRGLGSLDWMSSGDSARLKIHHSHVLRASSAITYTSVYTESEPGRAFWEPMRRRYLRETQPVPQDEDEREPMFIQTQDPDYVSEPIYPEYIPLEDEHEFPAEEQPLPPVDSPTTESPGYVTESDLEEDPEEDDADEDEDDEEDEHLAPADSAIVDYRPALDFHIPSTRGSRYEIGESSTARPTRGRGIDYGFVSTVDAEERRQGIRDVGYGSQKLAEIMSNDNQDLLCFTKGYDLDSRSRISRRVVWTAAR